MSRLSVWFIYSIVVSLGFVIYGRLPHEIGWVIGGTIGSGSALFTHWLCNRNFD